MANLIIASGRNELFNSTLQNLIMFILNHLGTLNNKTQVLNREEEDESLLRPEQRLSEPTGVGIGFKEVLLSHGPIISFTVLNVKGLFRRNEVDNMTNRRLMQRTVDEIASLELGEVVIFSPPKQLQGYII